MEKSMCFCVFFRLRLAGDGNRHMVPCVLSNFVRDIYGFLILMSKMGLCGFMFYVRLGLLGHG